MATRGEKTRRTRRDAARGHLLLLACSQSKREDLALAPALHLYDGVNYRVLRKILLEHGWPPGLQIKILSAKYGLIDATTLIAPYELRLTPEAARKINRQIVARLRQLPASAKVFVNLGKDYLPAVEGLDKVFPNSKITYAQGPIGMKMKAMKKWLEGLRYRTAAVRGCSKKKHSYMYFFPDWDDYIYEPFSSDEEDVGEVKRRRTYAHEVCGKRVPFDGILLSLAHLHVGKGTLFRLRDVGSRRVGLRRRLRIPGHILLFGDCGAFSYIGERRPPFTSEEAAALYHRFGFDIGASVDHIPLPEVPVRQSGGIMQKKPLSATARYARMYLTRDNAEEFLGICRRHHYAFTPLGVIQGIGTQSYVERLHEYLDMGYEHVALGGLVPRTDNDILDILCAVRRALQERTRGCRKNVWVHLFGILRPKIQPVFKELGVSSFDSASFFRKAWLRSDQNYLAPDGGRWYGSIRVPISTSRAMREAAASRGFSEDSLVTMERRCLDAIEACGNDAGARARVIRSINRYGPLLERKGEDNHFADRHDLLLRDRPWEKCSCPFCQSAGMHVVVFRGASRNKRRGLHNTWVFYHKVLHGDAVPTALPETD
jgi:hypothetical protein